MMGLILGWGSLQLCQSLVNELILSRSFLNFLRIFCKLKEQFLRVWENFAPPPGIRPSFFAPGQGIRQKKNCPGGRDSLAQKSFPGGCPGGMYPVGID